MRPSGDPLKKELNLALAQLRQAAAEHRRRLWEDRRSSSLRKLLTDIARLLGLTES
jgi:hypothetical protein